MEYDCNGNITKLRRRGLVDNLHGGFGLVDNLSMTYEGNMLTSVCDSASRYSYAGATDFDGVPGQVYPLTYNGSGSLVSDAGRGIARIDYDRLNNPVRIQFTNGSVTRYVYSTAGEKLRVIHQTAVPNITVAIGSARELAPSEILSADSTDYLLGEYSGNASQDDIYFYYYDRDHLGNIRQVVKAGRTTNGTVVQTMDYYPFGAQFCDGSTDSNVQSRRYNGKELDRMHGLDTYDYGARQYDPVTARWDRVDPLCEKYYNISPYAYCGGNPVMHIDPDGRKILPVLYRENNKDLLMPKYYRSMSSFVNAMEEFGKTTWGRHLISSFVDKGKSHYGVRGNGEYSDITLIIKEFNLNNSVLQTAKMMEDGVKIAGSLHARKNDEGELFFEMKIDASRAESQMAETITHEFTLHGALIDETIDIYRKKGVDEALEFFYKTTEEQDHIKNKPLYEKTKDELLHNKPEYENAF